MAYVEASELNIAPGEQFEIWIGPPARPTWLNPGQHWLATDPTVRLNDRFLDYQRSVRMHASAPFNESRWSDSWTSATYYGLVSTSRISKMLIIAGTG